MLINKMKGCFTQIPNSLITSKDLSNGAKMVYVYIASKPTGWNVFNKDVMTQMGIKKEATLSKYWKELIESGWITRSKVVGTTDNKCKNGSYVYTVYNEKNHKSYRDYLKSNEWKTIARKVRKRDKYKCVLCNNISNLQVHHTTYDNIFKETNHLEDLITVCSNCHKKIHNIKEGK